MIIIGDIHSKRYPEVYWNATKKLFNWLLENFQNETIIQLGDLLDTSSPHSEVEDFLAENIKKFKEFHLLIGNHDYSSRAGIRSKIFRHLHDKIFIYEKEMEITIENIKCLMLPYQNSMEHYNNLKVKCDYVFAHVTPKEESFGNEFISFDNINCKKVILGHIHKKVEYSNTKIVGCPLPTRNLEVSSPLLKITENGIEEIQIPEFLRIETVSYDTPIESLNSDWLYNIFESPSYNDVYEKFKGFNIRAEGIILKETKMENSLTETPKSLKDWWTNFCKDKDIRKEVFECGLISIENS